MLEDADLERLFVDLSLPEAGREFVRAARRNSPIRSPTSNGGNVLVYHYSPKMDESHLKLESHTVEGEAAMLHEDDPEDLEFWPQPCRIDLQLKDADGQNKGRQIHKPDFLVIRNREIIVEEWREESRLIRLANEGDQFYKDENGWHFRAAEEHFKPLGLRYRLRSAVELPHILIQNARFLQDYQIPSCPPADTSVAAKLAEILGSRGSVSLEELVHGERIPADDIFKCIVKKSVAVNLRFDRIDRPAEFFIHRDMAIARTHHAMSENRAPILPIPGMGALAAGSVVTFDGKKYRVALVGGGKVLLQDTDGQRIELLLKDVIALFANKEIDITAPADSANSKFGTLTDYTSDELARAEKRLEALESSDPSSCSERSRQRWSGSIVGVTDYLDKILALVDDQSERGNDNPRLLDDVERLAKEAIDVWYNTPTCKTALAVWRKYQTMCEEAKLKWMSYPTFTKRVKKYRSIRSREGAKKEYQVNNIPLYLDYRRPLHGVLPHEVIYIDHTIATQATIGINGADLGKPTLSLATDGHTTQQRALYMSYDPASSAVVLMVLRDYVRRHGRLPRVLVVDGGDDLSSREIRAFCRIYGIDLRLRKGKPRGGAAVERALGATEVEVFAQMEGNTRIMRNARMVTKDVDPFRRAEWTLTALHGAAESYLFDARETRVHPTLGVTPKQYEEMRVIETGQRNHKLVRFDEDLMLMTSPHSKRWFHTIDRQRGVWADNMYYWHDCLRVAEHKEKVEVRVEPWNANVIYICFRGRWMAAIARDLRAFAGRHRREVEMALRQERKRAKVTAARDRQSKITAEKMLRLWSPENFDERIGQQQREMAHLYSKLGLTTLLAQHTCEDAPVQNPDSKIESPTLSTCSGNSSNALHGSEEMRQKPSEIWEDTNEFV